MAMGIMAWVGGNNVFAIGGQHLFHCRQTSWKQRAWLGRLQKKDENKIMHEQKKHDVCIQKIQTQNNIS